MILALALLALIPVEGLLALQAPPTRRDIELVDPVRVDAAIKKGVEYLRTASSPPGVQGIPDSDELILLALLHAGLPESDPTVKDYLDRVLSAPLEHTYCVALQAMALEELDRVKHQKRIFQCAQFLVDNQSVDGRWSYGETTTYPPFPEGTPSGGRRDVASKPAGVIDFSKAPIRTKPKVVQRVPVRKQRDGKRGDNSNTQYAALGLRACHEAGIMIPREVVDAGAEWWRVCQERSAKDEEPRRPAVATGPVPAAEALGWGYGDGKDCKGSMTAGAVGSLAIYAHLSGKDWRRDSDVLEGMAWLAKNFTVAENALSGGQWHYYYLYGLERAGMLCSVETFGKHPWYSPGADVLLASQKENGAWHGGSKKDVWDTCFAILFLKRATRPLRDVASVDPISR